MGNLAWEVMDDGAVLVVVNIGRGEEMKSYDSLVAAKRAMHKIIDDYGKEEN